MVSRDGGLTLAHAAIATRGHLMPCCQDAWEPGGVAVPALRVRQGSEMLWAPGLHRAHSEPDPLLPSSPDPTQATTP